ncbi:MAG: M20/M25/M40 family metallo-hydrolase [Bacillota bacterium]
MVNEKRIVQEFMELVKIDSETRNERKIADYLTNKLQSLGLEVFEDDTGGKIGGNAGNLIAMLKGKKDGPTIVFSAHMDTVQPGVGVQPIIVGNAIKSKGDTILGSDDKAGIAAILELLEVINGGGIDHVPLQIIFTVAEEGGLHGAKNLNPQNIKGDFAYVLDSGGSAGHVVIQGPAQNQLEIVVTGKAAHAGMAPQEGINAIQIAARGIARMRLGKIDEETTANIGIIRGGKATNIIPDKVEIEGEARSLNEDKLEQQCNHMTECLIRAQEELGGKVDVQIIPSYPSIKIDEEEEVISIAQKAAQNLGFPFSLDKTGGGSDANILNGYGIPTANLGIGMEKVHTTEEYITIDNLVKNAEYLVEIVKVASE